MDNLDKTKNAMKYICEKCEYKTNNKYDYKKHLGTAKHNMDNNIVNKSQINSFECMCGKVYKYNTGLYKHKKKCNYKEEENIKCEIVENNINLEQLVVKLFKENDDIKEIMKKQQDQIELQQLYLKKQQEQLSELIPKVGNNNNNTQFNLNIFLNEECKDAIDWTEFVNSIELELNHLNLLKDSNMTTSITMAMRNKINELGVNKRPIHCYDTKRRKLCIKNNKDWEKEDEKIDELLEKGDKNLQHKYITLVEDWENNHKEWQKDENKVDEYMELQKKLYEDIDKKKTITNLIKDINIPKI